MEWLTVNTIKYILKFSYERSLGFLNSQDWIVAVALYWVFFSILSFKGLGHRSFYLATFISYVFLMYMFTVFERPVRENYIVELIPFWSYRQINMGNRTLMLEVALNVLMFVPIGAILRLANLRFIRTIVTALVLSYGVEALQLVFKRGYCEFFDDPLHNLLGAIIGFGFASLVLLMGRKITDIFDNDLNER